MSQTFKYGSTTIKTLQNELRTIQQGLRTARVNEVQLRDNDLVDRADLAQKKNPKYPAAKYIISLKHTEKQIRQANVIRKTLDGYRHGALSYVLIPSLSNYSELEQSQPDFNYKNMQIIWDKVTPYNGKKYRYLGMY